MAGGAPLTRHVRFRMGRRDRMMTTVERQGPMARSSMVRPRRPVATVEHCTCGNPPHAHDRYPPSRVSRTRDRRTKGHGACRAVGGAGDASRMAASDVAQVICENRAFTTVNAGIGRVMRVCGVSSTRGRAEGAADRPGRSGCRHVWTARVGGVIRTGRRLFRPVCGKRGPGPGTRG